MSTSANGAKSAKSPEQIAIEEGHSSFLVKLREFAERELNAKSFELKESAPVEGMEGANPDVFYSNDSVMFIGEAKPNKKELRKSSAQMESYLTYAAGHANGRKVIITYSLPWNIHYTAFRLFNTLVKENQALSALVDGTIDCEFRCIGEEYNSTIPMPAGLGDQFMREPREVVKALADRVVTLKESYVDVSELVFDNNNIRLYGSGRDLTQEECRNLLAQEVSVKDSRQEGTLERSISNMLTGSITDPIYGERLENGKIRVLEGNRRLYYVTHLLENVASAPGYTKIPVLEFTEAISDIDRIMFKSYLQESAKIAHLKHARAYEIWQMHLNNMSHEDIAKWFVLEDTKVVRTSIATCDYCFNDCKMTQEEYAKNYLVVYNIFNQTEYARSAEGQIAHDADKKKNITPERMISAILNSNCEDWHSPEGRTAIKGLTGAYNNMRRLGDEKDNITEAIRRFCDGQSDYVTPGGWTEKHKAAAGTAKYSTAKSSFKRGCTSLNSFQNEVANLISQDKLTKEQRNAIVEALRDFEDSLNSLRQCVSKGTSVDSLDKISAGNILGK